MQPDVAAGKKKNAKVLECESYTTNLESSFAIGCGTAPMRGQAILLARQAAKANAEAA